MNSLLLTDSYKLSHHQMYPEGTTLVFSNFTPRSDKHAPKQLQGKGVVVFGVQMVLTIIHEHFQENFFNRTQKEVIDDIKSKLEPFLGSEYNTSHFEALHNLGYLPIEVRALPEGSICPIGVPMLTIHNTLDEFYWLPNFLESILSNLLWKPVTSATIAKGYREILDRWAIKTAGSTDDVEWQAHDFSMRGMDSIHAVISSGLGHLTQFSGTDALPTLYGAEKYYGETGFVAGSVPATEHSVMCAGTKEDEITTFRRLLDIYPKGILSVVSDTWDLWNVITNILPQIKEEILNRDGKLVIRPDSGDPVDILCGKFLICSKNLSISYDNKPSDKGVIELLWDIFGGTVNEQGYKVLNPHIGAIYGDSINLDRAEEICKRLEAKGFASTNVVLGIGSFTYQYNTRDTFGMAMKATYVEINGEGRPIFKDPVTDDGLKKSAKGLIRVIKNEDGVFSLEEDAGWLDVTYGNELQLVYSDGLRTSQKETLSQIRQKLKENG